MALHLFLVCLMSMLFAQSMYETNVHFQTTIFYPIQAGLRLYITLPYVHFTYTNLAIFYSWR